MSTAIPTATLLLLLAAGGALADAETGWVLEDADEGAGWALYHKPVEGSSEPLYRLTGRTDAAPERVIGALQIKFQDNRYLPAGQTRVTLERGEDFLISHLHVDAPIVSDRDTVVRVTWRTDPDTGVHRMSWGPPAHGAPPTAPGIERIISRGFWLITPTAGGGADIVYQTHNEIGDSVPRWLIERMLNRQIVGELAILEAILESGPADVAAPGQASD
jgi:hypothetical protein